MRKVWLPLVFLLAYILMDLAWRLWRQLHAETEGSEFPDIDAAWAEATRNLDQAGIDLTETPLFLILGEPRGSGPALFDAAHLPLLVSFAPRRPDAPLHLYADRDGIYVTCPGASLLGRQASLLNADRWLSPVASPSVAVDRHAPLGPAARRGELGEAVSLRQDLLIGPGERTAETAPAREMNAGGGGAGVGPRADRTPGGRHGPAVGQAPAGPGPELGRGPALDRPPRASLPPDRPGPEALLPDQRGPPAHPLRRHGRRRGRPSDRGRLPEGPLGGASGPQGPLPDVRDGLRPGGGARVPRVRRVLPGGAAPPVPGATPAALSRHRADGSPPDGPGRLALDRPGPVPGPRLQALAAGGPGRDPAADGRSRNVRLYQLLRTIHGQHERLYRIIYQAILHEARGPILLGGCYLAGTGREAARDKAFVAGVFRRLIENQNYVSWTEDALTEEANNRRWARYGLVAIVGYLTGLSVLAYLFWRG